jgi:uncharacterized protein YkwD
MDFIVTLVLLTNQARSTALTVDKALVKVAQIRAEEACVWWGHEPNVEGYRGKKRLYGLAEVFYAMPMTYLKEGGENLVKDFTDPKVAQRALMNSPKHKENIVNPIYKRIGVAKAKSCNAYAVIFSN